MDIKTARPNYIQLSSRKDLDKKRYYFYTAEVMTDSTRDVLGGFEQIVLLALLRLGDDAYGVPIRQAIEQRTGRAVTVGALYSTLDRLEAKGLVSSTFSDPRPERGGRSRRYFRCEPAGVRALERARDMLASMWDGLKIAGPKGKEA